MIKLIQPTINFEKQIILAINEFEKNDGIKNGIHGSSYLCDYPNINEWIEFVNYGNGKNQVPFKQYLAINEAEEIIGFFNIRLTLNEYLLNYGGNIGYSVLPSKRKKGLGTQMLKIGLGFCKELGLKKILITCNQNNKASEKIIINNGGIFDDIRKNGDEFYKRFWIYL